MSEHFDYIVCGTGAAGSVIARRLSDDSDTNVLVLEAGRTDDVASVVDPKRWAENVGSERDWGFACEPNQHLGGRTIPLSMGKVLGGGTGINALQWMRDWDGFASTVNGPGWSFESVSGIYGSIERRSHPERHNGADREAAVTLPTLCEAAASIGLPVYASPNLEMNEGVGGASVVEAITLRGKRQSIYRATSTRWQGGRTS